MFRVLPVLPPHPAILDIGRDSGRQTLVLARLAPDAQVTAVDLFQPVLDTLDVGARKAGVADRVRTVRASMDALSFPPGFFDLLWAEGSIFLIGLEAGLAAWKKFIQPGGYLAFTEACWFVETPFREARAFWEQCYPQIKTVGETRDVIAGAGYEVCADFSLPPSTWWDEYYTPMLARLPAAREECRDTPGAAEFFAGIDQEIGMHRHHSGDYGYKFFLLRAPA
jgi:trans-aconitate methyltransferase